ncbi:MAG: HD domain-containing protein [Ilumatobacteraceae bacterium]|jgi:hypothetical protein
MNIRHLARRTWYSLRPPAVSEDDVNNVQAILSADEYRLWSQMCQSDMAHSLMVLQRFRRVAPDAPKEVHAGVLLHDVGKVASNLNTLQRVVATVVGPRTKRFRLYHDHETIGKDLLLSVNSSEETIRTACGEGEWSMHLRHADDL